MQEEMVSITLKVPRSRAIVRVPRSANKVWAGTGVLVWINSVTKYACVRMLDGKCKGIEGGFLINELEFVNSEN